MLGEYICAIHLLGVEYYKHYLFIYLYLHIFFNQPSAVTRCVAFETATSTQEILWGAPFKLRLECN